jgi:hypothetical protein
MANIKVDLKVRDNYRLAFGFGYWALTTTEYAKGWKISRGKLVYKYENSQIFDNKIKRNKFCRAIANGVRGTIEMELGFSKYRITFRDNNYSTKVIKNDLS